ncbi:DUF423 domain-containing protein [Hyphococcus lacteus]|uniref:DUF423 domain-containing protein n=1 Tax=Hyphococcus lacteus TaxID=3143536 RepID=A0ABV3Z2K4_9PROT
MKPLILAAGVSGFIAVALGAFGAHGLTLSSEATGWWNTASHYFLIHSVAALFLSGQRRPIAGWAFIAGSVFFAGSLYVMALGGPRILGALTPIGGLCYLIGWAIIALSGMRNINAADAESVQ